MMHKETKKTFNPESEVKAIRVRLRRHTRDKTEMFNPALSLLLWKENCNFFAHCLELDIVADGETEQAAYRNVADLIVAQIEFAEENNVELLHPAPREFWDKFIEIGINQAKQSLLDSPPLSSKELVKGLEPINA